MCEPYRRSGISLKPAAALGEAGVTIDTALERNLQQCEGNAVPGADVTLLLLFRSEKTRSYFEAAFSFVT